MSEASEAVSPVAEPDAIQKYAELVVRIRRVEAEMDALNEELKHYERPIEDLLLQRQIQRCTVNTGGHAVTVYQKRQIWATVREGFTKEQAVAALKADKQTESFVKEQFNSQSVSAFVREELSSGRELPVMFREGQPLDVITKTSIEHRVGAIRESDGAAASRALDQQRKA